MPFSGYQDLDPRFAAALQRFVAAYPGVSPYSGYRSPEHQAELYAAAIKKYGSPEAARKWVAPPGGSYHNKRLAVDLAYADAAARQAAHANAAKYNLVFPMEHEPWHVELAGARGDLRHVGGAGSGPGYFNTPEGEEDLSLGEVFAPNLSLLPLPSSRAGANLSSSAGGGISLAGDTGGGGGQSGLPGSELSPLVLETQDVAMSPDVLGRPWETGAKRTFRSPQDLELADIFKVKDIGHAEALKRRV